MMNQRIIVHKRIIVLGIVIAAAMLLYPAQAQNESTEAGSGRGVVTFAANASYQTTTPHELFPHTCDTDLCAMLQPLLYPRLFDVNPATGALMDASESDRALAASLPSDVPADEVVIPLRQDRMWSDGEPVTAYDVLFSLLAFRESAQNPYYPALSEIAGVRVIDTYTLALRYAATEPEIAELPPNVSPLARTCDDLPRSNVYILPSHHIVPGFRQFVDDSPPEGDSPSLEDWWKAYHRAELTPPSVIPDEPVTSGVYMWAGLNSDQIAQFIPADGSGPAVERIPNPSGGFSGIDSLIAGDVNVLVDIPVEQRAALRELADVSTRNFQTAELPGHESLVILLNLADPRRPLPGFHPETGEAIDQGQHPIFGDITVRRALQLAIDQNEIVEGVFQQSAVPLSGLMPPASWAYDPLLPPFETNLVEANRLLDEAGWLDRNGDGVRECVRCQTAPPGMQLSFTLASPYLVTHYNTVSQIIQQWRRIGVLASDIGGNETALLGQTFDAYLLPVGGQPYENADPDPSLMLTPAGDVLNPEYTPLVWNFGSYNNTEVTRLVAQARTLPGCDLASRAEIYHQVERLLLEDLPFLYVAAPDEFYAATPNVLGFAPHTGDPLWNIESWVVSP